jgi:hypothetical protein
VAATYGAVRLRASALVECDVGINAGTATGGVLGAGVLMLLVCLAGTAVVVRLVPNRAAAGVLALVLIAACAWLLLATTGAPDGYPSPIPTCVDNVPRWWPGGCRPEAADHPMELPPEWW